jgi:hypothetical protein
VAEHPLAITALLCMTFNGPPGWSAWAGAWACWTAKGTTFALCRWGPPCAPRQRGIRSGSSPPKSVASWYALPLPPYLSDCRSHPPTPPLPTSLTHTQSRHACRRTRDRSRPVMVQVGSDGVTHSLHRVYTVKAFYRILQLLQEFSPVRKAPSQPASCQAKNGGRRVAIAGDVALDNACGALPRIPQSRPRPR